jgi:DNA-directed RNA polymerase subunit RPC12/RpoP
MGQMPAQANKDSYVCENCGQKNPYPHKLSNYLIEGDYPVVQGANQAPRPKRYEFPCKYCGYKNPVDL